MSWRYDPVFISEKYTVEFHKRAFVDLAEKLHPYTSQCVVSFIDLYEKTKMNYMKVSNANKYIEDVKRDLMAFRDELDDIRDIEGLNIDIGGFLTFADFFFDGLIADIFVQSKINDARRQVQEAITRVEGILRQLREYKY